MACTWECRYLSADALTAVVCSCFWEVEALMTGEHDIGENSVGTTCYGDLNSDTS